LVEAKKEETAVDVDPKSHMESKVLNWFYQTQFWNENKDKIELNPQSPIATMDNRIRELTKRSLPSNILLDNILSTVEGLQNGDMKECPKCKKARTLEDFQDSSLVLRVKKQKVSKMKEL
jgi:hypothetical protein